jgi:hypothetical protein
MDAALKIAIPGEHRGDDKPAGGDVLLDGFG